MRTSTLAAVVIGFGVLTNQAAAQAAPQTEEQELQQIEDSLVTKYTPPRTPKKLLRAPTMFVTGTVTETEEAGPEEFGANEPKPEDALRLALRHKRGLLEHCFEMELRKQAVFSGFVVLLVNVTAQGRVTRAEVKEGNRREAAVGSCIASQLRALKLPVLAYDAELIVPIRLEAKQPNPVTFGSI